MLNLSKEECSNFVPVMVDYDTEEAQQRDKNLKEAYDLRDIYFDKECQNYLKHACCTNSIPYKIIKYGNVYLNDLITSNTKKLLQGLKKKIEQLDIKINNYAITNHLTTDYVKSIFRVDENLIYNFIISPTKQTFHQHYAAKHIRQMPGVENFTELPASGYDAYYLTAGGTAITHKEYAITGKSIDFKWEYTFGGKTLTFYATHKHTKQSGGSQDNQYKDVQEFHNFAKNSINPHECFISITDGPYYQNREKACSVAGMTKLQYLNSKVFNGMRNHAVTINTLHKCVLEEIIEWLNSNFANSEIKEEVEKLTILKDNSL